MGARGVHVNDRDDAHPLVPGTSLVCHDKTHSYDGQKHSILETQVSDAQLYAHWNLAPVLSVH